MADRNRVGRSSRRCEICGALSRPVSSFVYDAEYSYDDYYQTDSVKVCPYSSKLECVDCHKKTHPGIRTKE